MCSVLIFLRTLRATPAGSRSETKLRGVLPPAGSSAAIDPGAAALCSLNSTRTSLRADIDSPFSWKNSGKTRSIHKYYVLQINSQ
jgi:hypothetical protein